MKNVLGGPYILYYRTFRKLELELIQSKMAQNPMLRGEVGARAWRVFGQAKKLTQGSGVKARKLLVNTFEFGYVYWPTAGTSHDAGSAKTLFPGCSLR